MYLSRGSNDTQSADKVMLLQCGFDTDGGSESGDSNQVVATGVAHTGQGIVLGTETHRTDSLAPGSSRGRSGRLVLGHKGCLDPVGATGHIEALGLQVVRQNLVGKDFLVAKLGVRMDLNKKG